MQNGISHIMSAAVERFSARFHQRVFLHIYALVLKFSIPTCGNDLACAFDHFYAYKKGVVLVKLHILIESK